ncbi:mei2 [Symbiodinium sp. KB8]|nr:mei2 [Symbiodinium sp. KB8]
MFLELLDHHGFAGRYDFAYLPCDFYMDANLGYAFVNLVDSTAVEDLWAAFDGFVGWSLPSAKVCQVRWSGPHQGFEAHVERYRNSPVMHRSVPDQYKPVIFKDGVRKPFPRATKKVQRAIRTLCFVKAVLQDKVEKGLSRANMDLYQEAFRPLGVSTFQYEKLVSHASKCKATKGSIVVRGGVPHRRFVLLTHGAAIAYKHESGQKPDSFGTPICRYVGRLTRSIEPKDDIEVPVRGSVVGGSALVDGAVSEKPYPFDIVAAEDTEWLEWDLEDLQSIIDAQGWRAVQASFYHLLYVEILRTLDRHRAFSIKKETVGNPANSTSTNCDDNGDCGDGDGDNNCKNLLLYFFCNAFGWMARRAPHGKDGKEESVVDWMRLLWPILPEVGEPGKDFGSTAEEDGEVRARPRRRRSPSALAYVAAFGILAITWMSFKFSEQHAKIEDPLRQLRYYLTLLLLPIVLYTTGKNWHAGTHFPMTASTSFQVLRNRAVEPAASELTGGDVYCMLANGVFFCYLFLWNLALLLQRHRDRDVFDPSAHLLVPLCVGSALLRAKPTLLCFLFFGMVCLLFGCLLLLSGLLASIALLVWIGVGFEGPRSKISLSLDLGSAYEVLGVADQRGAHPQVFLWGATDVNTGPTSVTKARHCRIDVVQYLSSHMEVLDVMPVPKLEPGEVIPNEDHPSDHFPVFVTFTLKDSYEKHRDCARAWLECVAGREKVHPLTDEELRDAFEFFDRDRQECIHRRDLEEACLDLRCNFSVDVPKLLVDCFPNKQISFQNFLRAYEASLGSDRMRAVGDLECAFRYFAGEKDSIEIDTLEAAFREITPISFSDDEVKDMIGRVAQDGSPYGKASVHLKDFCEVVCKATFPNRQVSPDSGVTGTESETWAARNATKEISTRLTKLHKTVSGQGLHRNVSKSSNVSEMPIRIDKHLAPPLVH